MSERNSSSLWWVLGVVFVLSFLILLSMGREVYRHAPPIPDRVVDSSGALLFTGEDIRTGQQVWRSIGGQQTGSIWGHGSYVAPDWNADWLHREAEALLDAVANKSYKALSSSWQAMVKEQVKQDIDMSQHFTSL